MIDFLSDPIVLEIILEFIFIKNCLYYIFFNEIKSNSKKVVIKNFPASLILCFQICKSNLSNHTTPFRSVMRRQQIKH
jgi:hypothetical protein